MNTFDLNSRLNPQGIRPAGVAFPEQSVSSLQGQSARRRQITFEVLRLTNTTDETGGQSSSWKLIGQYSGWLQEVNQPQEETIPGTPVDTVTRYMLGAPEDADVRFDDEIATPGWLNAWTASSNNAVDQIIIPASPDRGNGHVYSAIQAGVTDSEEPVWPTQPGGTVQDGTVIWKEIGEIHYLQVIGDDAAKSTPAEKIILCQEIR